MSSKIFLIALALICAQAVANAEPAMWVIRDKDSTIYLIGTIHLLRRDAEWNRTKVDKTVAESTDLWLELADADDQAGILALMKKYGLDPEKPLSAKLNFVQNEKLARIAAEYNIPAANLEPMKPWMVALMVSVLPLQKAGYDPKAGIDLLLKTQAEKEGDKIHGFETMEQQVRLLADLPEKEQIAFLEHTFDDVEQGLGLLDELAKAWIDGDTDTIGRVLVDEIKREPSLYQKFFVERNIAFSKKIVEILKGSGVQQIAVGAGHLAGPDSVQAQLAKRGIKVERY